MQSHCAHPRQNHFYFLGLTLTALSCQRAVKLCKRPVDFFEVTVEEDGIQRSARKFLMRLMYSGHSPSTSCPSHLFRMSKGNPPQAERSLCIDSAVACRWVRETRLTSCGEPVLSLFVLPINDLDHPHTPMIPATPG